MDIEKPPVDPPLDEISCRTAVSQQPRNPPQGSHLWMTTQEAAEHSGYDVQYLRRLARQGKIGAVKKGRGRWIDIEQYAAYLNMMLDSGDGRAGPKPPRQEAP